MKIDNRMNSSAVLLAVILLSGCSPSAQIPSAAAVEIAPVPTTPEVPATQGLPLALVHKSPTCGCCGLWVDHLKEEGFQVEVRDSEDVMAVKQSLGVPYGKGSCHTAEIGGYFIEGHVPAEDIKRLLVERPDAKGLVLPGMPMGSPGMEGPEGTAKPYTVELVARDGTTSPFSQH